MYNPYTIGMPPYQQYGQQMQQPMQFQQQPMNQPPAQSGLDWIPVQDIKQVEQVQVQPGGKSWVMLQNEPIFALRVADQMGLVTTTYYRFEKIDPAATAPTAQQDFVTRDEFEKFVQSLKRPTRRKTETPEEDEK